MIRWNVSKYCSMQTENWILKKLCLFTMPNSIDVPSWLLLSSFLITSLLAMCNFWFRSFCWFPAFQGFRFLSYTLMFYKAYFTLVWVLFSHPMVYFSIPHKFPTVQENATKPMVWGKSGKHTHTFPRVWVLFSHPIPILWYTSAYEKCMGFPINFPQYRKMQ